MALGISTNRTEKVREGKFKKSLRNVSQDLETFEDPLLCDYQRAWIEDSSPVIVVEKSRQIGFSYIFALKAVLDCLDNKRDFIYSSYNLAGCKTFIADVQKWCVFFNLVLNTYELEPFNENDFNIFEIKFPNGRFVLATSGNPTNFRGRSGCSILIDEAAYREHPLDDILASAFGNLIHGGKVIIGSTHAGDDNDFNALCEAVRKGEKEYSHHKVTFRDAIAQGLFKRICYKTGDSYTPESTEKYIEMIYGLYGVRAEEELDVVPGNYGQEGKIFTGLKAYDSGFNDPWNWVYFRYHDLAATGKKIDLKNEIKGDRKSLEKDPFYTASVKVAFNVTNNLMVVVDYKAEQINSLDADNWMIEVAVEDGRNVTQVIEQEPGSSGIKYADIMRERMAAKGLFQTDSYRPMLNKITRAIPAANLAMHGQLLIMPEIQDDFNKIIKRFSAKPTPLVSDITDCVSGLVDFVTNFWNPL